MIKTNENRKDNVIAWCTTIGTMTLLLILLLACSLKTQIPPPPPKQMVYVDISPMGGGGGGGTPQVASNPKPAAGQNYATQNAQDAPAVNHSNRTSTNTQTQTVPSQPKPDQSSMYHGRSGRGSNGGDGNGSGPGHGDGLGPGNGGGHGGGVGYGTGGRGLTTSINTTVSEEGKVCVEVHVMADGSIDPNSVRVISYVKTPDGKQFRTTISNSNIQNQCIREAKKAHYKPGKEELRIIVFSS